MNLYIFEWKIDSVVSLRHEFKTINRVAFNILQLCGEKLQSEG